MARLGLAELRSRVPISLREALFLFILLRLSLSVYAIAVTFMFQVPPPCFHNGVVDWTSMPVLYSDGADARLFGVWQRWDACWYLRIAQFGYEPGEPGTAFFPLYPMAIRVLGPWLFGNLTLAALAVSGIAYVAAMAILHAMVTRDVDRETAERSMLYLSVFPTAFFLFAPFTESTFLALALERSTRCEPVVTACPDRRLLAGLTRPQGLLMIPTGKHLAVACPPLRSRYRLTTSTAVAAAAPRPGSDHSSSCKLATGLSPFDPDKQHWGYANAAPWMSSATPGNGCSIRPMPASPTSRP
jgi:hypothetical protein